MFFGNSCCNRCHTTTNSCCCNNNNIRTIPIVGPQGPAGPVGPAGPAGEPGTVTPGVAVTDLDATADLATVITTVNALLASLRGAGLIES